MAEEGENSGGNGAGARKSKRFGFFVLIAGILGGLAVGGGIMYFLDGGGSGKPSAERSRTPDQSESGKGKDGEQSVDLLTVNVERFAVPLIDENDNRLGYVWVDLTFEVDGPENQSYVSAHMPELRDAYLRDLHTRQTTREDRPGALDFDLLKNRLQAVAEDTLGQDRVLAVRIVNARPAPG